MNKKALIMIGAIALLVLPMVASAQDDHILYERDDGLLFTTAGQQRHCSKYPDRTGVITSSKYLCTQYMKETTVVNIFKAKLEAPTGNWKYGAFIGEYEIPYKPSASLNNPILFECYIDCDPIPTDCEPGDRLCVTETVYKYCSGGDWATGTCPSNQACSNGYCSSGAKGAICGDGKCSTGEENVCYEDCTFLDEDDDYQDYLDEVEEKGSEVCLYGKDTIAKTCDSAKWVDYPGCYWDESFCEDEEANEGGCITKPRKRCEAAVWDADNCRWDESRCSGEPSCPVDPDKIDKSCEDAIWMDYPTCAYNTDLCDYIPTNSDKDGDGIWDVVDDCPSIYGTETNGCPAEINTRTNYIYIGVVAGILIFGTIIAFTLIRRKK